MAEFEMKPNLKERIDLFTPFKVVRYKTIAQVMEQLGGEPVFESIGSNGDGKFEEESKEFLFEDALEGIKETGIWGFIGKDDYTIHFWADNPDLETLIFFFGHEIGHVMDTYDTDDSSFEGTPDEGLIHAVRNENVADGYAFTATEAYRLAKEII